jgi:predicted Zn-dependent peptidase
VRITKLLILLVLFTSLVYPQTRLEDIQTFTLKNGMKFIVLEDHSIPNANLYIFFKVGSRNEYPGITGLSHFFEHMMFNGAKKYGPGMFDKVMEANGGANNAYTSENVTVYTDWFPADKMDVMFELEADRIGDLALDDKMVESERGVVLSERITSMENSHFNFLEEQVKGVAYLAHPYRWSVIGYESDIRNWKKEDLQRYFDTYYAPNNAVAVVVGAVDTATVKAMAEKHFAPIPRRPAPRPVHTKEPEQLGEKRLTVKRAVSTPNLLIVHHVPQSNSEDFYALSLLNSILSEGRSSRLYKSLIDEQQLAVRLFSFFQKSFDPTLFYIYAVAARNVDEIKLEQAIYKEIDAIVIEGVTDKELKKVQNRKVMEFYRSMETINRRANSIGEYEVFFGGYEKLFSAPDKYKAVTIEDIKKVAAKYFKKSNRTVGVLKKDEEA